MGTIRKSLSLGASGGRMDPLARILLQMGVPASVFEAHEDGEVINKLLLSGVAKPIIRVDLRCLQCSCVDI